MKLQRLTSLCPLTLPLLIAAFAFQGATASAQTRSITRVSVDSNELEANGQSTSSSLNTDGTLISFSTAATNLNNSDFNNDFDVYLRNTVLGTTVLVSQNMSVGGSQESGAVTSTELGREQVLSGDGSIVAFTSAASELQPSDSNGALDVLFRNPALDITAGISLNTSTSFPASGESRHPTISSNGNFVAFASAAPDIVTGDTNVQRDVFLRDRGLGSSVRISVATNGDQGDAVSDFPSISSDGQRVAFASEATNFLIADFNSAQDVFLRDISAGTTTLMSISRTNTETNGDSHEPSISGDGTVVAFSSDASNITAGDTNTVRDIYARVISTARSERVSLSSEGRQPNAACSAPAVSADGRLVVFASTATNLVAGDTNGVSDIFLRDRLTGITSRVSIAPDGTQANGNSYKPDISADGTVISFSSVATNLISSDTNFAEDVFVVQPAPVFTRDIVITIPPDVEVVGDDATVTVPQFAGISTKRKPAAALPNSPAVAAATARRPSARTPPLRLKYEVTLTKPDNRTQKRLAKRNTFTFQNLPPGQYSVKFRLVGERDKKVKFRSGFSPSTTFGIG